MMHKFLLLLRGLLNIEHEPILMNFFACQVSHSLLCDGVVVKEDATVCPGSILSFKVPLISLHNSNMFLRRQT